MGDEIVAAVGMFWLCCAAAAWSTTLFSSQSLALVRPNDSGPCRSAPDLAKKTSLFTSSYPSSPLAGA